MIKESRSQNEIWEEKRRRESCEKLSASIPNGAFTDDPNADSHDKNGRVRQNINSNLVSSPWDLGQFPPNE